MKCAAKGCGVRGRVMEARDDRYCEFHREERDNAAKVLGLGAQYEGILQQGIPKSLTKIEPEELDAWYVKHRHPGVNKGAIGGAISMITTPTSIGEIRHVQCDICGENAYIADVL